MHCTDLGYALNMLPFLESYAYSCDHAILRVFYLAILSSENVPNIKISFTYKSSLYLSVHSQIRKCAQHVKYQEIYI